MTVSRHPHINEELLSAYIDNEVSNEERRLIEAAIVEDPALAWQVESLRQTVSLLQELAPLKLPQAFAIEDILAAEQARSAAPRNASVTRMSQATAAPQQLHWWQRLAAIWQSGNPYLRNAAAFACALLVVLLTSGRFVAPVPLSPTAEQSVAQPAAQAVIVERAAAEPSPVEQPAPAEQPVAKQPVVAQATSAQGQTATPADTVLPVAPESAAQSAESQQDIAASDGEVNAAAVTQEDKATVAQVQPPTATARTIARALGRPPGDDMEDLRGGNPAGGEEVGGQTGPATEALYATGNSVRMNTPPPGSAEITAAASVADNAAENVIAESAVDESEVDESVTVTAPQGGSNVVLSPTLTLTAQKTITASAATTSTALVDAAAGADQDHPETQLQRSTTPVPVDTERVLGPSAAPATAWLSWLQIAAALLTVVLGTLWWQSRS